MCEFSPRCKVGSHSRGGTCPVTGRQGGTRGPVRDYESSFRKALDENTARRFRPAAVRPLGPTTRPRRTQARTEPARKTLTIFEKRLGDRKPPFTVKASETTENLVASWVFEPDSIFSVAAEELFAAKSRLLRYRWKKKHWLCGLLWEAAEFLDGAQASELVGDSVSEICAKGGIPQFAANILEKCASKAIDASLPGSPKQIAVFLRVVVALFCPNADTCSYGTMAIDFLLMPGVEAALRDLASG